MTVGKKSRRRRVRGKALLVAGSIALLGLTGCDDVAEEAEEANTEEPTPVGNLVAPEPLPPPPPEVVEGEAEAAPEEAVGGTEETEQVADPEVEDSPE